MRIKEERMQTILALPNPLNETDQIIPCNIIGSWDLCSLQYDNDGGNGTSLFVLDNWEIIEGIFMSMYSTQTTKN